MSANAALSDSSIQLGNSGVCALYRSVCAMGGVINGSFLIDWSWAALAAGARDSLGEADVTTVKSVYTSRLLSYERSHKADCVLPVCALCSLTEPPTRRAISRKRRRWSDVWLACSSCSAWMVRLSNVLIATQQEALITLLVGCSQHTACSSVTRTVVSEAGQSGGACFFCLPCLHRRGHSMLASSDDSGPTFDDELEGGIEDETPYSLQLLPPYASTPRAFGAVSGRCVPPVDDFATYSALMHGAKRILQMALSTELVSRSLGFLPDEADSIHKTVCLLTPTEQPARVLSAMVLCGDAHKIATQVLVAATDPEARQGGCMRALLTAVAQHAARHGISLMCLATARTDKRAATVWQRLGFRPVPCWPTGFVHRTTSADLGQVFVRATAPLVSGQAQEPTVRLSSQPLLSDASALHVGAPAEWPDHVPFTSGTVAGELHPAVWPKLREPRVVIKRIPSDVEAHPCRGQYGVFARTALQATTCLMSYGGILRTAQASDSRLVVSLGGGLDVDAASCGNEARYINHYAGIAERPNCQLLVRMDACSGQRWACVSLLHAVPAGAELLLDYGPDAAAGLVPLIPWVPRKRRNSDRKARSAFD